MQPLAHVAVAVVRAAYAKFSEEPNSRAVEQIAAEVHHNNEYDGAHGDNYGFTRLGPIQHGVNVDVVLPVNKNGCR